MRETERRATVWNETGFGENFRAEIAVTEDDVRIHYSGGEQADETIVFLHGFPQTWRERELVMPPLAAKGFTIVAPDLGVPIYYCTIRRRLFGKAMKYPMRRLAHFPRRFFAAAFVSRFANEKPARRAGDGGNTAAESRPAIPVLTD